MNFTTLKYFSVLAEELSFTKAAKKLYISQQALSSHINKLEQHFDSQLFIRTTPLELTPAGQVLYLFAQETLRYEKLMTEKIHKLSLEDTPQITIATTLSRGNVFMPLVLPAFQRLYPEVKVHLIQSTSEFAEQLLLDKKADVLIGYTPAPKDSITSEFLCMDTHHLYITEACIRGAYPNDWQERISLLQTHCDLSLLSRCYFIKMLDTLPLGRNFNNICKDQQFQPKIYLEVRAIETLVALCMENLGAIICPDMFVSIPLRSITPNCADRLYKLPVESNIPIPSVSISYQNVPQVPEHILEFVKLVKDAVQSLA